MMGPQRFQFGLIRRFVGLTLALGIVVGFGREAARADGPGLPHAELQRRRDEFNESILGKEVRLRRGATKISFSRRWLPIDIGMLCVVIPSSWTIAGEEMRDERGMVVVLSAKLGGPSGVVGLSLSSFMNEPKKARACLSTVSHKRTTARVKRGDASTFDAVTLRTNVAFNTDLLAWVRDTAADTVEDDF
jgi:hypothetical protein